MDRLPEYLKKYRAKHKLTQSDFASKIHVTKQAVSKWETGRGFPDSSIIPLIAKELGLSIDTLMGEKHFNKKYFVRYILTIILMIIAVIIAPMLLSKYRTDRQYNYLKNSVEEQTGLDLPDKGILVYKNFNDWVNFGNAIQIEKMSYFVFDTYDQTILFEISLENDIKWTSSLNQDLLNLIPTYLHGYEDTSDYFLIYNKDNKTYNETVLEPGEYEYLFIVYQLENNRFLFFEYDRSIE